ncbi:MAG: mechanosensitive ion channel family protein [Gemmatimonadota bacterium]|nr:mechanosensitive ion channel family protein [Gemmatimonadota bacterium]
MISLSLIQDSLVAEPSRAEGWLTEVLGRFGVEADVAALRAIEAVAIVVVAWLVLRASRLLLKRFERHFVRTGAGPLEEDEQRAKTLTQLLGSVITAAVVVATLLTVLNLFIPIGPLLAGVGVVGLAVSFGAQSLVKDMISGFFILLENQLAIGDVVELNGKGGVVERMTLRVVAIRDLEGIVHTIPNGSIQMVSNRTRSWSRAVIDVGVAYKENVDNVMRVCREVLEVFAKDADWSEKLSDAPVVQGVQALADSAVTIRLLVPTEPGKQWEVKRELLRRLKNRFDEEGIEIPFPQRTLHLADGERLFEGLRR